MTLKKCIMTNSTCYKDQLDTNSYYYWGNHKDKIGIVVHSTGANNPYIKRYVQPSDNDSNYDSIIADIGKNTNYNDWNHTERAAGVHAFIGKNINDEIRTYEVLPYEWSAWGVGQGSKGSYNYAPTAHIQFEICEDDLTDENYFYAVMKESQEYCAYLCNQFGWTSKNVCCHAEAHERGYGGNHADIKHWLNIYGKTMDWYRNEVQKLIDNNFSTNTNTKYIEYTIQKGDSLSAIAKQYNTTVTTLSEINNIDNPNQIYAGQVILIPTENEIIVQPQPEITPITTNYFEYTIQKGDNLSKIAKTYNTTVAVLCEINNIEDKNKIYAGQIILIPAAEATIEPQPEPTQPEVLTKEPYPGTASTGSDEDAKVMWDYMLEKIGNEYGVAGLMGNIQAESNLRSNNLENSYEKKETINMNDEEYTTAVDNGTYTNFIQDHAGYGLAQWTYWSRKEWLYNYSQECKKSICDYQMQLEFLWKELSRDFKKVVETLKTATSVREASDAVLLGFEKPKNQGEEYQERRAAMGQTFYDKFRIVIEEPKLEEKPIIKEEEKPIVEEEKPIVEEEKPIIKEEEKPIVEEEKPIVEDILDLGTVILLKDDAKKTNGSSIFFLFHLFKFYIKQHRVENDQLIYTIGIFKDFSFFDFDITAENLIVVN